MSTPKEETNFFKGKTPRNVIVGLGTIVAICVASLGFYTMSRQQAKQAAAAQDAKSGKTNFAKADQDDNHDPLDSEITDQELKARRDAQQYQRSPGRNPTKPSLDDSEPGAMNQFQQGGVGTSQSGQDGIDQVYTAGIHRPGGSQINQQRANSLDTPLDDMSPDKLEARNAAAAGSNGLTAQEAADLAVKMNNANSTGTGAAAAQTADLGFISNAKKAAQAGEGFSTASFVGQEKSCTLAPPSHIPVFTIEALNSDRPGRVALVVADDVYDSVTGTCLMIPKGSKIVGPYSSDIRVGAERILVATTELRLPNGKEVPLNGAQGADQDGAAGFSGDVNNHFFEIYGASFLTAILLGAFDNTSTVSTTTSPYGVSQVGTTAGQVAAQTSQSILNRYQNIPPTITVAPGTRFMVQVNQDIHLEPYRD
jgi:type IV secretory pathway VirB10-like protein